MTPALTRLNTSPSGEARSSFMACCNASRWADRMTRSRPYPSEHDLLRAADEAWSAMNKEDWLEAMSHHPRIGERHAGPGVGAPSLAWSRREQAAALGADEAIRGMLAARNREYEGRFGHVFLICATGKSPEEMLESLESRLANDPEAELRVAARELGLITRIRLEKLLRS